MAANSLPLELQQQIFQFLDSKSFYAARKVSRWWRYASTDTITLARQLKKLPILPTVHLATCSPWDLQHLFDEAAHTLMLGMQARRQPDTSGNMTHKIPAPRICATSNGNRTVTLNGRTIVLFDTSSTPHKVLVQRRLNDLMETVGSGPWLKITPTSSHELALSSDGSLLAVAQERTIQIYDLTAGPDSFTVNEYIPSATGHYICGLDFEQIDHVLRVRLSGKGTVIYCGTPPPKSKGIEKAVIDHWKSKAGLKHSFLDSSLLTLSAPVSSVDSTTYRIAGLQLLKPFHNGYLFASQKHGGGSSSHYILGHVKTSVPRNSTSLTAEPNSVTILADLASFLSSWEFTLNASAENGSLLWENMPSAHEHHPRFAISPDNGLLVLAEREKKHLRASLMHQVFAYRLPSERKMIRTIEESQQQSTGKWASPETFLDGLDSKSKRQKMDGDVVVNKPQKTSYSVARIPLSLATITGDLTELVLEDTVQESGRGYALRVATSETTRRWTLADC